jgi:glutamate 5-kinase
MNLPGWKRAVIKVGSNLIAPEGRGLSTRYLLGIARLIAEFRSEGRELVLVSSGAVAAGRAVLGLEPTGRRSVAAKQALAAVGQVRMMEAWSRLFDRPCAQVMLTADDISNRRRFVNAKNTLRELLALDTLPIVNENDSVATEELKLGDNDNLAAHVAVLIEADLLIILSDVDGLFDADPRSAASAQLIAEVVQIDAGIMALAGGSGSSVGTGGMRTKLQAADKAARRGIATLILNGRSTDALDALRRGRNPGTLFRAHGSKLSARAHWMKHGLESQGVVVIDAGAERALRDRGASLLPPGVLAVRGNFRAGDAIDIVCGEADSERRIAKGVSQYDAVELGRIKGHGKADLERLLGYVGSEVVVHRDDMVVFRDDARAAPASQGVAP